MRKALIGDRAVAFKRTPIGDDGLTVKQRRVARLLARGLTMPETADRIGITRETVDTYCGMIYAKLGIHSRVELVAWAILTGLVDARSVRRKPRKTTAKKKTKRRRRRCPKCGHRF